MKYPIIIAILILFVCGLFSVCYADSSILPDEISWLDDPYYLESLFGEWYSEDPEIQGWYAEYVQVVIENWGKGGKLPYSWHGDLNHDGIANMIDFGKAAAEYRGRILCHQGHITSDARGTLEMRHLRTLCFLLLLSDTSGDMG